MELLDIGMCIDIPPINHSSFILHSPPDTVEGERTDKMCSVKFGPRTKMTFSFMHVAGGGGGLGAAPPPPRNLD